MIEKDLQWHSVDEVPEYDKKYLVYYDSGNYAVLFFWADTWKNFTRPFPNGDRIVAWMYLPEPPNRN